MWSVRSSLNRSGSQRHNEINIGNLDRVRISFNCSFAGWNMCQPIDTTSTTTYIIALACLIANTMVINTFIHTVGRFLRKWRKHFMSISGSGSYQFQGVGFRRGHLGHVHLHLGQRRRGAGERRTRWRSRQRRWEGRRRRRTQGNPGTVVVVVWLEKWEKFVEGDTAVFIAVEIHEQLVQNLGKRWEKREIGNGSVEKKENVNIALKCICLPCNVKANKT